MAVVSNTSPVRHMILLGRSDLIGKLFGTVLIPEAVERELSESRAPLRVRQWMEKRPSWLKVRRIEGPPDEDLSQQLDPGETEAIQLALQLEAEVIILDERLGREVASDRGLTVIGALGILREAYRQGWIDNPLELLQTLRRQGFRMSRPLVRRFEEQIRLARPN